MHSLRVAKSTATLLRTRVGGTTTSRGFAVSSISAATPPPPPTHQTVEVYEGGLAKAARVMKLASVASLVGASAALPFFFTGDSDIPSGARTILALTTLGMTGSSTAIITWALRPYITSIRLVSSTSVAQEVVGPSTPLLVDTLTFWAQTRTRLVFPQQLVAATMPLTSWSVREPSRELELKSREILEVVNKGNKRNRVELAREGDVFYAHTQGPVTALMQQILDAAPCQE
ncbi:hypothetical protein IWW38_003200 [Coemansia aciculifera]|uniref:Uncharacterized protein n=1 Tax=Coemansia aciculifera TaxID=417176 RepID=A0ACC1M350_9FUNG|nr:hypothetical protein IWW38_003200 [Coemansia aciculifera]